MHSDHETPRSSVAFLEAKRKLVNANEPGRTNQEAAR
jgi:hypothetical protein